MARSLDELLLLLLLLFKIPQLKEKLKLRLFVLAEFIFCKQYFLFFFYFLKIFFFVFFYFVRELNNYNKKKEHLQNCFMGRNNNYWKSVWVRKSKKERNAYFM